MAEKNRENGYRLLLKAMLNCRAQTGKQIASHGFSIEEFVKLVREQTSLTVNVQKVGKTTYVIPKHDLHKTAIASTLPTLHAFWCEKFLSEELPKHELNYNEVKV